MCFSVCVSVCLNEDTNVPQVGVGLVQCATALYGSLLTESCRYGQVQARVSVPADWLLSTVSTDLVI